MAAPVNARASAKLDLRRIAPGAYYLEVIVRTEDGYEISRQRPFEVVP